MSKLTAIEWTDHTFNPWWGCAKVSDGCKHCYAETWAKRCGQIVWGLDAARRFFGEKHWAEPLAWNRAAESAGVPARVFCASMADVFEDREDLIPERAKLWELIKVTPWLRWQLLTKRPENIEAMLPADWAFGYDNVWLGCTVENQAAVDKRGPIMMNLTATEKFFSYEPALGPVDVRDYLGDNVEGSNGILYDGISWVICGGESGPGARPMHSGWARSIRDQCDVANVPFLFKQWGEYTPFATFGMRDEPDCWVRKADGRVGTEQEAIEVKGEWTGVWKVGKKKAGRVLDGRTHDDFPKEAAPC